jgi:hypothetical protein
MKESDVGGKIGEEQGRPLPLPRVSRVPGQGEGRNTPEPAKRKADEEWLAFATEDPAFFIKPSDTV